MKKILLLSLLVLFGCSKDNRDNSQGDIPQDTIVSAFFGLDNVLPGLLCNQPGSQLDGMPVNFKFPLDVSSLSETDFEVVDRLGNIHTPNCVSLAPANENGENRSVLLLGESGTGKELVAREIHNRSSRKQRTLIKVNCASIPKELYESEFFGHVRGAFTGAVKNRMGRFELADGGTLFLDEVGEIPLDLQSKLLRVLQEGSFERIGDEKTIRVDVRLVAATNRNLKSEVSKGRFREDLYYRLHVFPLEVPPLRERVEDIPLLAGHFLQLAKKKINRTEVNLSKANIAALQNYNWPGNVRELQNVIERAVIISSSNRLKIDLPKIVSGQKAPVGKISNKNLFLKERVSTFAEIKQFERENILRALNQTNWKIFGADGAAELLGIPPTTLTSRISRMGLEKDKA